MKRIKNIQATFLAAVMFFGLFTFLTPYAGATELIEEPVPIELTGWRAERNAWYYYVDDIVYTGWLELDDTWFYLGTGGKMATGWLTVDGTRYYFDPTGGNMVTGWCAIGDKWYYFNEDGAMMTGWVADGDSWYFLNSNGTMATGWVTWGNCRYYLDPGGVMVTGWQLFGDKWFCFDDNGVMMTGWFLYNNYWYHFNNKGEMAAREWKEIDKVWYNFAPSGLMYTASGNGNARLSATQANFVERYQGIASALSVQYGIPWEAVMAQGILESAAGTSGFAQNRNNFFGIGAVDHNPGNARYYDSPQDGWEGYYRFIRDNARYRNNGIFSGATVIDPYAYIRAVKAAGYATDPDYVAKLTPLVTAILNLAYSKGWQTSVELYDYNPHMQQAAAQNARGR